MVMSRALGHMAAPEATLPKRPGPGGAMGAVARVDAGPCPAEGVTQAACRHAVAARCRTTWPPESLPTRTGDPWGLL